jgi:hypothetical protein
LVGARVALHPGVALGETVLERFRAAAEGLREGTALVVVALSFDRVLRAVVVLLLEALVILSLVTGITAMLFEVSVVTGSGTALIVVLGSALALIDVHVAMLLVVGCGLTVALNPDVAVFLYASSRRAVALDPDFPVDVRRVCRLGLRLRLRLRRFLMDVDVDVSFLLGRLGLVRLLVWLQSSQVAEHLAEAGMRDVEFLLSVLQLLLLAE